MSGVVRRLTGFPTGGGFAVLLPTVGVKPNRKEGYDGVCLLKIVESDFFRGDRVAPSYEQTG